MEHPYQTAEHLRDEFELSAYLREREERDDFVLVELGHGSKPAAFGNPDDFTGKRAYIGIEIWERDDRHIRRDMLDRLQEHHAERNIYFIDRSIVALSEMERAAASEIMPDGAADELLLANVLGDPNVSGDIRTLRELLNEGRRLLAPDGKLVIRETITPPNWIILRDFLRQADFEPQDVIHTYDREAWDLLEPIYGSGGMYIYVDPASYYMIAR